MRRRVALAFALLPLALALHAAPAGAQRPETFVIFFESWSGHLDPAATEVIAAAAALAKSRSGPVEIHGYASPIGSREANRYLSLLRAQVVFDGLVAAGIPPARLTGIGEGIVQYVDSPQESRRVEIIVGPR